MNRRRRAIVPLSLGLGMLGVVVAAGLSPNAGVVRAASNCTYGQCVSSQPFPLWAVASSVAAVVVALLLALLFLRRRRRPGQPPSEWQGPEGGAPPGVMGPEQPPSEGATAAAAGVAAQEPPVWHEGTAETTSEEPGAAMPLEPGPSAGTPPPEYIEPSTAPEPAPSVTPPPEPAPLAPPVSGRASAQGAPSPTKEPSAEGEPDIDSLMAELEKISGEILKQKPKKRNGAPPPSASDGTSS